MIHLNATETCNDLLDEYSDDSERALALEVAEALCELSMRRPVVRVGFLGRLRHRDGGLSSTLLARLDDEETALFNDLENLALIDKLHEKKQQNIERLRQMLLSMANDVRVITIKLALQVIAMRHLSDYPEAKRTQLALQTRDIFAPLANRLGIAKLKWELEDLALRELEPTTYRLIASSLAEQRRERLAYVEGIVDTLKNTIEAEGIDAPIVYGRAKHINSIFNKMKKKNKRLEEIYDLLAVRIQVETLKDCYTALGIVHAMWKHIPSEFDDYIANPKPNGYQSLHTAVVGPEGKTIEIQIRTHEMHDYAELGVAAHWRYKENATGKVSAFERQINWLRHLLNEDDEALADEFTAEITEDRVYAITPQGQVIDLPNGSTPLDFAYYIHTDLGHRTKGARANGQLVPMTYHIKTGDTIEILTNKKPNPSRDWLNPHAGYLKSSKARGKVRHFFRQLARDNAVEEGAALLQKQLLNQEKVSDDELAKAVAHFNFKASDDLFAALGFGDLGVVSAANFINALRENKNTDLHDIGSRLARIPIRKPSRRSSGVTIEGIDDLLISMASCCSPVPPEPITGFITRTKGISIHRANCPNIIQLAETQADKIMEVNWAMNDAGFAVAVHLQGMDRVSLIRDISQALANEGASVQKVNFSRDDEGNFTMQLTLTVHDSSHIERCLKRLRQVKNVQMAVRVETVGG